MEHVRVIALAVQAVQHRNEPASQARKYNVGIPPHFNEVASQAGQVLDENQIDNALSRVLQHFQKSRPLKVTPAKAVVTVCINKIPASVLHIMLKQEFLGCTV